MITIEARGFKEAEQALAGVKNGFSQAMKKSINASLKAGKTEAAQLVRKRYNVKAPTIKEGLSMQKATGSHLGGELEAKGPMLPLSEFNPRARLKKASGGGKQTHQYVYAAIVRGKAKLIKGAFMPHKTVLERRQPSRLPIFPVSVIGVGSMVGSLKIQPEVEERMRQAYETALHYNVNFYLDRAAARSRKFKA